MEYFWIGLGSAIGGIARHKLTVLVTSRLGGVFPWGTVLVNISGSFLIGLLAALTATPGRLPIPEAGRHFLMVGILGGYTTFSAFSLQTFQLANEGTWLACGGNILVSVAGCLIAVVLGYGLGHALQR
jgi:CrcB protein